MTAAPSATWIYRTCATCGHTGRYGSEKFAAYHFGRHSCELVVMRRERTARREAQLAAGGPERPCTCKRANHKHGDRGRYVADKCRCHLCRVAQRQFEAKRLRDVAYGRARHVEGGPARDHVRSLMAQGMGIRRIADAAGVAQSVVAKLLYGRGARGTGDPAEVRPPTKKLERGIAAKILAVELDLAPGCRVPVVGTTRRLQALVTIGWSQSKLAAALRIMPTNLTGLIHGTRNPNLSTVRDVAALYDELWDQQPPQATRFDRNAYSRATRYASAHGWAPPLAWDDDTIDQPDALPEHQAQPVVEDGPTHPARRVTTAVVHVDDVEFLTDQGYRRDAIADQLGVKTASLQTALDRAGRRDLWVRLCDREGIRLEKTAA